MRLWQLVVVVHTINVIIDVPKFVFVSEESTIVHALNNACEKSPLPNVRTNQDVDMICLAACSIDSITKKIVWPLRMVLQTSDFKNPSKRCTMSLSMRFLSQDNHFVIKFLCRTAEVGVVSTTRGYNV
jgi:hypothetical protein